MTTIMGMLMEDYICASNGLKGEKGEEGKGREGEGYVGMWEVKHYRVDGIYIISTMEGG